MSDDEARAIADEAMRRGMYPGEVVSRFDCYRCGKGGETPDVEGRARLGCPWCGGQLTWGAAVPRPAPAALFGVGPDEVLFCPACKRGGPASLAPRRPDGVFHCPLCTGLLTPLLVPPTPDAVFFPGMEDAAPGDPTPEIKT